MKAPRDGFAMWQDFAILLARVLIGWLFVESGLRKLMGMDAFIASLVQRRVPYATVFGWIGAPLEFFDQPLRRLERERCGAVHHGPAFSPKGRY